METYTFFAKQLTERKNNEFFTITMTFFYNYPNFVYNVSQKLFNLNNWNKHQKFRTFIMFNLYISFRPNIATSNFFRTNFVGFKLLTKFSSLTPNYVLKIKKKLICSLVLRRRLVKPSICKYNTGYIYILIEIYLHT